MKKGLGTIFCASWLLCGCSIDTFFDGGAVWFLAGLTCLIISAVLFDE